MASKRCMNGGCAATAPSGEWRKGWALRSGGFAALCDKCGMAYEESIFCDLFHQKESGWRECLLCGKRLHCGCIASKFLLDLLDNGGVQCIGCMKKSGHTFIPSAAILEDLPQSSQRVTTICGRSLKDEEVNDDFSVALRIGACDLQPICVGQRIEDDTIAKGNIVQLGNSFEVSEQSNVLLDQIECVNGSFGHIKLEKVGPQVGEVGSGSATQGQACKGRFRVSQQDDIKDSITNSRICESLTQACLSISLGNSNQKNMKEATPGLGTQFVTLPLPNAIEEGKDQNKALSTFQQSQRARHLLPKPHRTGLGVPSEASKEVLSHMRVARPPGEGRGRSQLLPRYWPRITDQELQQISGDSNSTIVPLFEKVLSASDAGRIGRLVLPKACAEAYFPPISQPEGLPLKIQDAKGKEWHFQFRFWPNNNSRMYVLEGVTPCIQSLQLQAGDTVTFSRMDPEGKLVMGYRKATNSTPLQDSQISSIANAALGNETFFSSFTGNLPIVSGYSGLLQSMKGNGDPYLSCSSEHFNSTEGNISWRKTDKCGAKISEGLMLQPSLVTERKRSRNIGAKSKRLHIDNEDALELKVSWEEAQDFLTAPPTAKASIVVIEDYEFEEYEEAPVFAKQTIFTARISGEQDQWIQCDDCFKWRRLPVDVLVSSTWTCAENMWDLGRSSCSIPDELSLGELQNVLLQNAEIKRRRTTFCKQNALEMEVSTVDPLATAATLGDVANQASASVAVTTTKHPRHRPGCTCIVCIQPPSGKGPKHNPTCTCNVCMTVKRRFKTLMLRKKKRQSEREETETHKRLLPDWGNKDDKEGSSSSFNGLQGLDSQKEIDIGTEFGIATIEKLELEKAQIDLNYQPEHGAQQKADGSASSSRMSMMSLLHVANLPLENYLKQNGLTSLVSEQHVSSSSVTVPQTIAADDSEGRTPEGKTPAEGLFGATQDRERGGEEGYCSQDKPDKPKSDA